MAATDDIECFFADFTNELSKPVGSGSDKRKVLRVVLEEVGNNVWLLIRHKMPATDHDLRSHAAAAKLIG